MKYNNPVHVVRHDLPLIQCYFRPDKRCLHPLLCHDIANVIQYHPPIPHIPKPASPPLRIDRYEIGPDRSIIKSMEPFGITPVSSPKQFHNPPILCVGYSNAASPLPQPRHLSDRFHVRCTYCYGQLVQIDSVSDRIAVPVPTIPRNPVESES